MTRFFLSLLLIFVVAVSCHPPEQHHSVPVTAVDSGDKKHLFPVADVLTDQVNGVDSGAFRIMVYHTRNGRSDSGLVKAGGFRALAEAFLSPELDSAHLASRFSESSFMDQSTGLLNFTYATKDTLYGLRRVDVLVEPSLTTDKVHSIYAEVSSRRADTLVLQKLTWTASGNFSILDILQPPQGEALSRETRVVWNND